ncbi:predicted protein [Chaetomium globosum CBS 148.51]|uniref:Uncharacterized protein n=1 Tax=Chaetomium globosum (strain ATCC 6205 / CBS 148.51 / DSM 1962 / NBRC 6347 / NRRL 1970) TaxID=306901 RepID=Q2GN16_CHAGB|nr:uncharacterized protein CHGG_10638 [Chaetomium globosum CBS 148.51]EAQ84234.1 predicted protein [Chaetomium globosum CBS 148.51]
MEFKPNDASITSESAPLIEPVDCENDRDLFMVPLKRPSPRLPPSRYRNVKARTPPRSPVAPSPSSLQKSPQPASQLVGSLVYNSPPMSQGRNTKVGSSPVMSTEAGSARQSSELQSSSKENTTSASRSTGDKPNTSTKASSVYDSPPAIVEKKPEGNATDTQQEATAPPGHPPPLRCPQHLHLHLTKQARNLGLALHLSPNPNNN